MKKVVICDIDGTISDDRWRRSLIDSVGHDRYHEQASGDDPVHAVIQEVKRTVAENKADLYFVTGRPESMREETATWLHSWFSKIPFCLLMRGSNDALPSPELKQRLVSRHIDLPNVVAVFEDRTDVLAAYAEAGIKDEVMKLVDIDDEVMKLVDIDDEEAAGILSRAGDTYRERNQVYGSNWRNVAPVMRALFPDGVPSDLVLSDKWHLFELLIVKLTRYANSNLTHRDSIHDAMVYAAMVEHCNEEENL